MNLLAQDFGAIEAASGIVSPAGVGKLVTDALPWVFGAAGIILLLNVITSGIKMMTSKGDPKVMQAAQAKLTTSAIGVLILFVSFWIVQIIMQFMGINAILFN